VKDNISKVAGKTSSSFKIPEEDDPKSRTMSRKGDTLSSANKSIGFAAKAANARYEYELPMNCRLEMLKAGRIEKLEEDYVLMAHPFP
jgi:hypothetical protein